MKFGGDLNGDLESIEEVDAFFEQSTLPTERIEQKLNMDDRSSFMRMLRDRYLEYFPGVYNFVQHSISLSDIEDSKTALVNSSDFFDLKIIDEESLRLFINLQKINNVRWINRYFLEIHKRLLIGGFFIGRADSIETHKKHFFRKYPKYLREALYLAHFIFFRVFPKLPKLRKIYFSLTKGKNRMISRAEILGRLSFCGFKIISEDEIGGSFYFVAQKIKAPSRDLNPTYGPLIKLKRCGLNGQMIEVFKLRTMYPYSEYLQEYIYEHQRLKAGGKIYKDFRITEWGRFFRRYWLDELPMLYNWIKGDVKLFGVRPLSKHYLGLYDNYLQKARKKLKPGLIPPFYADLPKKFEEINESEKRYIQSYLKHPLKTQFTYFFRTINNIVFKGVRSS
jgi:hypothetical protein